MAPRHLMALAALAFLSACGSPSSDTDLASDTEPPVTREDAPVVSEDLPTVAGVIAAEPRFETLRAALDAAEMVDALEGDGPFTLFAPNNAAFDDLPGGITVELLSAPANRELLSAILAYHVVPQKLMAAELVGNASSVAVMSGQELPFDGTGAVVSVGVAPGNAVVTITDLEASNGVIHVIDRVLLPPTE